MAHKIAKIDSERLRPEWRREKYSRFSEVIIREHMKYYCSHFQDLPAVTVAIENGRPAIVRGIEYLDIAIELGKKSINAVIISEDNNKLREFVAELKGKIVGDASELLDGMTSGPVDCVHVFFFEDQISEQVYAGFQRDVICFFEDAISMVSGKKVSAHDVNISNGRKSIEFFIETYPGMDDLTSKLVRRISEFSDRCSKISSYQGMKLQL